jgi:site-specific recombinase XerD
MPQDYFPTGPFLGELRDRGAFDVAREDFLLGFAVRTARAYKTDLDDYYEWCETDGVDPMSPSPLDLDRFLRSVQARGYASSTVRRRAVALRGFFDHLVGKGFLSSSPAARLTA